MVWIMEWFFMPPEDEKENFALRILKLLQTVNGLDQRAIFKQTKIPPKSLVMVLDYLEHENLVDTIEHSGYLIYNINENGLSFLKKHESLENGAAEQKNENGKKE